VRFSSGEEEDERQHDCQEKNKSANVIANKIATNKPKKKRAKNAPKNVSKIEFDDIVLPMPVGLRGGWWCRDRDNWWVYQIPTSSQTWVDWYWCGKDKEGKDEWWSPTRSVEPAPWEERRAADGIMYTYKQFLAFYGEWGNGVWCSAGGRRVCVGYRLAESGGV